MKACVGLRSTRIGSRTSSAVEKLAVVVHLHVQVRQVLREAELTLADPRLDFQNVTWGLPRLFLAGAKRDESATFPASQAEVTKSWYSELPLFASFL